MQVSGASGGWLAGTRCNTARGAATLSFTLCNRHFDDGRDCAV